ncbi:MAG: 4'-phosphopantetheinyl transferase superfamily protein [Ruminococcus sp.]|uniref:4'-phosphopantetheinyl transferase family protein n=1 Tax=Ruminococcus sp. TaxID=41978 RepID=UPI0025F4E211|nr:4'-phosphopantetheinyl transferase superfamily protein [Ruminococcus sp.]MCR4794376.1 4'-phosphopantetheinyl transferase superfamily protein [Ruminococcus sp.]
MDIRIRTIDEIKNARSLPEADVIEIWYVDICKDIDIIKRSMYLINDAEKERYNRFLRDKDKLRYACGRIFTKMISAAYLGSKAEDILIYADKYYKPHIKEHSDILKYNISHSGDMVLLAFSSSGEIGIDIEQFDPCINESEICSAFHSEEIKAMAVGDNKRQFYRIWTAKEAYVKAVGKGFMIAPNSFFVDENGIVHDENDDKAYLYRVTGLNDFNGYFAALCYKSNGIR